MQNQPSLAYLFSRYPVVSQTFCDTEMMALEQRGFRIVVGSLNPPTTSFRHERLRHLQAECLYPPPREILDLPTRGACDADPIWQAMKTLALDHEHRYGASFKPLTRARNAWHFAREFASRRIKHIHIHFANRATHTALFLKKAGYTFSFTAHAQDFMIDLGSRELLQEMAREAEFVVAVSDFSQRLLQEMCPDSAHKIVRIYNGLDPAALSPSPLPDGPLKILSIGRLIDFKGFQHLIPAVAALRDRGVAARLEIIGAGPLQATLETLIDSFKLNDQVTLHGIQSQDQIKQHLHDCHVFALACIIDEKGASDILPTVILEAMAAGRPVVSTRLVGVPEMVEHGVNGLLAEPGQVDDLADQLLILAKDPARRASMGAAGREKFLEKFTLDHTAGDLAARFLKITGATPPFAPPTTLCLLSQWPGRTPAETVELAFLCQHKSVRLLAAESSAAPPLPDSSKLQFLPDAMLLESAWRASPQHVARLESLYEKCGPIPGELYFREARRAVYLASQLRHANIQHLHAFRSSMMLCTWLLHHLTQLPASATIEPQSTLPRATLQLIGKDFLSGSLADEKIALPWPDSLQLAVPDKSRKFFPSSKASVDFLSAWQPWLPV